MKKNFMSFGSRSFILTAAIVVILGGIVSGTVAWMFVKSEPVSNTFTYGDLRLELIESDSLIGDEDEYINKYNIKPGIEVAKDPYIEVGSGTIDCWVFVKINKSDNLDTFIEYEPADGWDELEKDVYCRKVKSSDVSQGFYILKDNKVSVKDSVTQQMLDELAEEDYPSISFTAYAIQTFDGETAKDAWEIAKDL